MNKYALLLFFVFQILNLKGQTKFESGYFIDKSDNRIECLIKNRNGKNTPQSFVYKLKEDAPEINSLFGDCKEFGIGENLRFIKHPVMIDRSLNYMQELSTSPRAVLEPDTLFLEVIGYGDVNLFHYLEKGLNRLFYQKSQEDLVQLVFKKYSQGEKVGTNSRYRQQLKNAFSCDGSTLETDRISYNKRQISSVIGKYCECNNISYKKYERKKMKLLNVGLKLEGMYESMQVRTTASQSTGSNSDKITKFENGTIIQYGIFIEYTIPYFNNRWSLLLEPTLQKITKEAEDDFLLEHRSIETPLGLRFYPILSPNFKFSINASYLMDLFSKTEVHPNRWVTLESDYVAGNFAFGLGFDYKRLGIDMRYKMGKDFLGKYGNSATLFRGTSCSLRVRLY